MTSDETNRANMRLVRRIGVVVIAMFGFGFAMVPFYNAFCEWTGLNGKVKGEATAVGTYRLDASREITLELITSLNEGMPLAFRSERSKLKVHPGQYYTVNFFAENTSDRKIVGQAIPSIAPGLFAGFLKKAECFCFSEQAFEPHRERMMPVRFVIDPDIPAEVKDMTLSYTFFDITDRRPN
jgi:cytochrome c oxidase assembly protein subunit 11